MKSIIVGTAGHIDHGKTTTTASILAVQARKGLAEVKAYAASQQTSIARQQKQIEALVAGLQKVSAQLELSKPAPQTVGNQK